MWIYFSLLFFGTPSVATHPPVSSHSRSSALFVSLAHFFFIPSICVIRIESFNKKFCSPAQSAPFCEFKWKSGRESGRGWRPGGRRALLACKLKCCHLNANKTPPRVESSVEKEGGEQRRGRKRDRRRGGKWQKVRRERANGKPGLTDRATEVLTRSKRKFRKEFLFHPSRASSYAPTFGVASAKFGIARQLSILSRLFPTTAIYLFYLLHDFQRLFFFSKFIQVIFIHDLFIIGCDDLYSAFCIIII